MKAKTKYGITTLAIVLLSAIFIASTGLWKEDKSAENFGLISPEDGTTFIDNTPVLTWRHNPEADHYEVWLDEEMVTDSACAGEHGFDAPHWYLVDSPLGTGSHTWYVVAVDEAGEKLQSSGKYSFTIDETPPESFDLVSPSDKASLNDNTPTLKWEASSEPHSGIDHYEVWLDGVNIDNVPAGTRSYEISDLPQTETPMKPSDPEMIPEARTVLYYLQSIYGKKSLQGQNHFEDAGLAYQTSGLWPAVMGIDLSGWTDATEWSYEHIKKVQKRITNVKNYWKNGGIPSIQWHFGDPIGDKQSMNSRPEANKDVNFEEMTTPGTDQYKDLMEDLEKYGDFLEQLSDANVPVLFRPFHEIDGGWFWWSHTYADDSLGRTGKPEHTAELWRIMYDYYVEERGFHNLIWVYNAGLSVNADTRDDDFTVTPEEIDFRRRFYPGDEYVDISSIDIYPSGWSGWGNYTHDAYQRAFDFMQKVTPGKMLAMGECRGTPNPALMEKEGPAWLYSYAWYMGGGNWNPKEWVEYTYHHEFMLTRDELPDLKDAGTGWHWWAVVAVDGDGNKTRSVSTQTFKEEEN